jgi:hypothetical protein
MTSVPGRFTIRRLLLANVMVAAVITWMIYLSDGNYVEFDERKTLLSIAMAFGLPALLTLVMIGRNESEMDRARAIRAGFGLHCLLMAGFCALPVIFYGPFLLTHARSLGPSDWIFIDWTAGPPLVVAALYSLGGVLVIREASRGSAPACGRDQAGR